MSKLPEKGTPLEKQTRNWGELNPTPYSSQDVHPYTRTRIILMNGIEVEGAIFSHQFARHAADPDLKRKLAATRRIEQQQQKVVNWLVPGTESDLEVTLGYEQVAVDLTAWLARTEPDPYVKAALDFALLEDFDHLYRYSNLLNMSEGKDPAKIVGDLTEIFPGRPTVLEHRHPFDSIRRACDAKAADPLTMLHLLTIVAGEQQTMNLYMTLGNRAVESLGRGLYAEIAQIEEQHVSHYESLMDPSTSWFQKLLMHEYNECYMYYSCMQSETDERIRKIWERNLEDEVEHLRLAGELMKQYEKRDPAEFIPEELPTLTVFESNKEYVRQTLESQIDRTADLTEFVPVQSLTRDHRYFAYQDMVNSHPVPSEVVIQDHIDRFGSDYRLEIGGEHPVERMRVRERLPDYRQKAA